MTISRICFAQVVLGTVGSWWCRWGSSFQSSCGIIVLTCFGPEGGSDDKQQHAAERQNAGGNFPAIRDLVLFRHLVFQGGDARAVFRSVIGWRGRIGEKPACLQRLNRQQQAEINKHEFHGSEWEVKQGRA